MLTRLIRVGALLWCAPPERAHPSRSSLGAGVPEVKS